MHMAAGAKSSAWAQESYQRLHMHKRYKHQLIRYKNVDIPWYHVPCSCSLLGLAWMPVPNPESAHRQHVMNTYSKFCKYTSFERLDAFSIQLIGRDGYQFEYWKLQIRATFEYETA